MPRTRQTAKKSTGGSAPRSSWREIKASSEAQAENRAQLREKVKEQLKTKASLAAEKPLQDSEYSENVSFIACYSSQYS
jgi:hypothetical protein